MGRFVGVVESQTAQPAGAPVTTTFNGYFACLVPGASANAKLRRIRWHVRGPAGSVTSDQHSLAIYRQTVRVAGTGFSTPLRVTAVSVTTLPQLGRWPITEGSASASPAGARSHRRAATLTQCPT